MRHKAWVKRITLLTTMGLLVATLLPNLKAAGDILDEPPTELEDFVIYGEPRVMDALRRRPFTKRDPIVERFFKQLPGITEQIYLDNLAIMKAYLDRTKADKERKLRQLSRLAGLDSTPAGLIEGYDDRIDTLETILKWVSKEKPVRLVQLDLWEESDLRYRLSRVPVQNIRQNPETGALESRLLFDWTMIYQKRSRARDVKLAFKIGINQQEQTGFYDPRGFLHWYNIRIKNLYPIKISYPVIITRELRNNPDSEIQAYISACKTTVDSFYHIIREFFFSDLADLHALYILTRGRIFSDEWKQYQNTPLQRGLAAYLAFQSLEDQIGVPKTKEILENDWTTWHLRKIGNQFNSVVWEGETEPYENYGAYKESPDLRNIYWSTKLVNYLVEQYGPSFVEDFCRALNNPGNRSQKGQSEEETFRQLTGDNLPEVIDSFKQRYSS